MSQEKIKNRIDLKKLTETLSIQTSLSDDEAMLAFIMENLKPLDVLVQEDAFGNIYVTKGSSDLYPCVIAHTDTVQPITNPMEIYRTGDTLFAFNPVKRIQCGIGGDDKVGVYILLQLLNDVPTMKAVFFREEEEGSKGAAFSMRNHKEWFENCGFVVAVDRKGNSDIVTYSGGLVITSDAFLEAHEELFTKYGYNEANGLCSDIDVLIRYDVGVSGINLSCGYHDPHSNREVVSISDVNKCYNLVYDLIYPPCNKKFEYKVPIVVPKTVTPIFNRTRVSQISDYSKLDGAYSVVPRQIKIFPPLVFSKSTGVYENFVEFDVLRSGKKVYSYTGTKTLPLTGSTTCAQCKSDAIDSIHFLPFEGRMFCTKCNDYVDDNKVGKLLEFLEVEDTTSTFVYSVYANGWLLKQHAMWNSQLCTWVSDELPF